MKKSINALLVLLILWSCGELLAQENGGVVFDINEIIIGDDNETVDILMAAYKITKDGGVNSLGGVDPSWYSVDETIDGQESNKLLIKNVEYISENLATGQRKQIYILMDASASMHQNGYVEAKNILKNVFKSNSLKNTAIHIAWFNDGLVESGVRKMEKNTFEEFLFIEAVSIEKFPKKSDLSKSLSEIIETLEGNDDQKMILLFTNGHSVIKEEENNPVIPNDFTFGNLNRYQIYTIGVGDLDNTDLLNTLSKQTPSPKDKFGNGKIPDTFYQTLLGGKDKSAANLKLTVKLDIESSIVGMESRSYVIRYKDGNGNNYADRIEKVFNPSGKTADTRSDGIVTFGFKEVLLTGVGIILGLLALFWVAIPLYSQFNFKKNHVKKYKDVKKAGVTASDPLTLEPINDEEMVVVMGKKVMLLDTWKYLKNNDGETSKDHAEFFEKQISGNFFNQRGAFQRLNWVWFGALGGFLSWGLEVFLSEFVHLDFYLEFLKGILDSPGKQISSAIYSATIIGVSMALGIVSCLALVDELGTSRSFNIARIIKRVLIGVAISIPLFFLESLLTASISLGGYIGGLVGWTLFGTAMGLTVTLYSGIQKKNGLIGGFISGVIAFHFYYLLQNIPQVIDVVNSDFARVTSLILYGGILGYFLFRVIFKLEDFELVYLSPEPFVGRVNPISKWLKSSSIDAVYIGADPACEIKIKWAQQDTRATIQPFHAKMTYEDGQVYISAMPVTDATEENKITDVLVNEQPVRKKFMLQNGDRIKLGVYSISIIQFNSRNKNSAPAASEKDAPKTIAVKVVAKGS